MFNENECDLPLFAAKEDLPLRSGGTAAYFTRTKFEHVYFPVTPNTGGRSIWLGKIYLFNDGNRESGVGECRQPFPLTTDTITNYEVREYVADYNRDGHADYLFGAFSKDADPKKNGLFIGAIGLLSGDEGDKCQNYWVVMPITGG